MYIIVWCDVHREKKNEWIKADMHDLNKKRLNCMQACIDPLQSRSMSCERSVSARLLLSCDISSLACLSQLSLLIGQRWLTLIVLHTGRRRGAPGRGREGAGLWPGQPGACCESHSCTGQQTWSSLTRSQDETQPEHTEAGCRGQLRGQRSTAAPWGSCEGP